MATTSPSFSKTTTFTKIPKGKRKKKEPKTDLETVASKKKLKKQSKESSSSEVTNCSKELVSSVPEPVWEIEYSEPVPDLYPELSDSLKMQESDTEQEDRVKVIRESQCDSEENVQCVPTSFDDHPLSQDSSYNPGTSQQSQNDSQQSNSNSQTTVNNTKRKRKLSKPKKVRRRSNTNNAQEISVMLSQAQETGKQGTWAQCSIPSCGKWRFLQNDVDPQELPERWVCAMNESDYYNTCTASQETFDSQEGNLDVMYTPYTSGAVVWAKMVGYPWWPAMMENDPDYGYYCETGEDNVTPVSYHVVFFDKEVSRAWVSAACIRNFSCDDDPEDLGKISVRGKSYRRQLTTATLAARSAAQLPIQTRLSQYGFAARYGGPIGYKAQEEERDANLEEEEEVGDSVTDSSSSQEVYSSGTSSYSSLEEVKKVKPKNPNKPKTSKQKTTDKPTKSKAKSKEGGSSKQKKETVKKKDNKTTSSKSKTSAKAISSDSKDCLPSNNKGGSASPEMTKPIHEPGITQNRNENSPEVTGPSVSDAKTYSEEAICEDEKNVGKPSTRPLQPGAENLSASKNTKAVKKRRSTNEAQGGKKRKTSTDTQGEKEKENTSTELLSSKETQNVAETGKEPLNEKHQMNTQDTFCVMEDGGSIYTMSTSSESQLVVPKEKQRKKSVKSKSTSQDNLVEEDAKEDKPSKPQTTTDNNTSSESQLGIPKEKKQRKKPGKSKSISQDNTVNEDATEEKTSETTESSNASSKSQPGVSKEKKQRKKSVKSKSISQDKSVSEDATVEKTSETTASSNAYSKSQPEVSKEKKQRIKSGKSKSVSQNKSAEEDVPVKKTLNETIESSNASSEYLPEVSKQKKQGKKSGKSKSISQDKSADEDVPVDNRSSQTLESKPSQSLIVTEESDKGKGPARPKNQTKQVSEKSNKKRGSSKSRSSSGEGASSSEVLDQSEESQNPGFDLKRSAASIDVRVDVAGLSEDNSAPKKSLPKLVKAAFRPPIANKGDKSGRAPAKMPKLLKPHFVSPALAKPTENKQDVGKEQVPKSVANSEKSVENNTTPKKDVAGKRKVQENEQLSASETSKKTREDEDHHPANDILSDDLQAEIDDIDNDIASMRKQLRVSDASDTSLPDEMTTPSITDLQISLSDSPEF